MKGEKLDTCLDIQTHLWEHWLNFENSELVYIEKITTTGDKKPKTRANKSNIYIVLHSFREFQKHILFSLRLNVSARNFSFSIRNVRYIIVRLYQWLLILYFELPMHHYEKEGPFCWSIMLKVIKVGKKYDNVTGTDPIDNSVVMKWLVDKIVFKIFFSSLLNSTLSLRITNAFLLWDPIKKSISINNSAFIRLVSTFHQMGIIWCSYQTTSFRAKN